MASEGSSTTESKDRMEDTILAVNMLAQGKRNIICGEVPTAVNQFQEACALFAKHYGETAKECAEAYFCYGQALLDLARMETGVLGNALQGVEVEEETEDKSSTEDKNSVDEQFEKADNLKETGEASGSGKEEDGGGEEESQEDEEEEMVEEETEEQGEGTSDSKGEGDADDVSNLQLAWEMLELAKMIYLKEEGKEAKLKAAQANLKLGEVSLETEQYEQAIEDFKACLTLQKELLDPSDRLLAETHYQLGLAYGFDKQYDNSIEHYRKAIKVIEDKIAELDKLIEENSTGKGKEPASIDDPVSNAQQEIKELKEILPDIASKIEDAEEEKKNLEELKSITKEVVGGTFSQLASGSGEGSSLSQKPEVKAKDISHLIRRKRKPEEDEAEDNESKKSRQEDETGDASVTTKQNGMEKTEEKTEEEPAKKTEEAPMEAEPVATS